MKTAVEQLRIELIINSKVKETLNGKVSFTIGLSKFDELFNQAKEMEKQQIIQASCCGGDGESEAEQYYNKTFKSE